MSRKTQSIKIEISDIAIGANDYKIDQTPVACNYNISVSGKVIERSEFKSSMSGRRLRKLYALKKQGADVDFKQRAARRLIESLLIHTAATTNHLDSAKLVRIVTPVKVSPLTKQIVDVIAESLGFVYCIEAKRSAH